MMKKKIQVGSIPFLNSKPVIHGYESYLDIADFHFMVPSRLSEQLADHTLDVGLVSSVEYLRGIYRIVPEVGIVSRGPVNSVLLTGAKPIEEARTVNLDPASLTSCSITILWYLLRLGKMPIFSRHPIQSDEARKCDAQLAIGDEGLFRAGQYPFQADLGAVWEEWTGYPFVYAAWLVRKGVNLGALAEFFMSAARRTKGSLEELAHEASRRFGVDSQVTLKYFTHYLQFRLSDEAIGGLRLFLKMAAENHDLLYAHIPGFPDLGASSPIELDFYTSTNLESNIVS